MLLRLALVVGFGLYVHVAPVAALSLDDDEQFAPGSLRIPRERNLSLKDYYEKYEDKQTPVIIEDYADAFSEMTEENIKDVCGHHNVSIARRVNEKGQWANIEWRWNGPLADTMRQVAEQSESSSADDFEPVEGSIVGVFDWALQRYCPELLERHFVVPKYIAQDYLQRVPHRVALNYRDSWPSLFVGVDGSYGGNHRDTFGSAFWMYVIDGAKEWHIVDSVEDYDFYGPDATPVRHFHDIIREGEILIIPGHRWHQVRNRGKTITLAGNFVSRGSFDTMKREVMKDTNAHKGTFYMQVAKTLLAPDFDMSIDYDQGDMTWKEFRAQGGHDPTEQVAHETGDLVAVLVTGAGSPEVNGCYLFNGMNEGAWQFELRDSACNDGRIFELFKVAGSKGWWNIQERVRGSYPNPVHYGATSNSNAVPRSGWESTKYRHYWLGKSPMPKIEVMDRNKCVESTKTQCDA